MQHLIWSSCAEEKEELLLVFMHLDPTNHQREFQLGVHVVEDNKYTGALQTHVICIVDKYIVWTCVQNRALSGDIGTSV